MRRLCYILFWAFCLCSTCLSTPLSSHIQKQCETAVQEYKEACHAYYRIYNQCHSPFRALPAHEQLYILMQAARDVWQKAHKLVRAYREAGLLIHDEWSTVATLMEPVRECK